MRLSEDCYLASNLLREHACSLAFNLRSVTPGSCIVDSFSLSLSFKLAVVIKYVCRSGALFLPKNRIKSCSLKDESLRHSKRPDYQVLSLNFLSCPFRFKLITVREIET